MELAVQHERGRGAGNARNGFYDKTVTTEIGEVDLRVPRDSTKRGLRA
ncbi:MAG TPA: transposase [Dehalococcoidia bacterium]